MRVMTAARHAAIPTGRPFTVADLAAMPDDGNRYELIDGMLIVSPAPGWAHQEMGLALYALLRGTCPREYRALAAPFAVQLASDSEVQPDVLVTRYEDLTPKHLPVPPLLAAEVASPSTALHDRNTKKAFYERVGVASYWLLDPTEPGALTAFELTEEGYRQIGHAVGDEPFDAEQPFPVRIVPARLLDGLRPFAEGRVVAVNVAVVRTDPWTRVKSGRSGIDKRPVDGPVALLSYGVDGDTICDTEHHGGPDQAVYAYGCEDLAFWAAELGQQVTPGGVGENLTLAGVDCSGAVVGERWQVGGDAELRVRGPRIPCRVFAGFRGAPDLIKRFVAAGRPGCYLSVERTGRVRAGDPVRVLDRPAHGVTVADVMAAMTVDRERARLVAAARDDLGERGRDWMDRTLFNLARTGSRVTGGGCS